MGVWERAMGVSIAVELLVFICGALASIPKFTGTVRLRMKLLNFDGWSCARGEGS